MSSVTKQYDIERAVLDAVDASRGHFRYESGHHGDLWLELDALFVDAGRMRAWASALARRAEASGAELACGPLTGGAFLAQGVAVELGVGFGFAERSTSQDGAVRYLLPDSVRRAARGKRVLLVDDVINAGSAARSTLAALHECGAELAGIATLLALGDDALRVAHEHAVELFKLASLERRLWEPEQCPLCRAGDEPSCPELRKES